MKLEFTDERLLAVVAHADDAELLCAGTLARGRADGGAIAVCVMCQGDKGQPSQGVKEIADVRKREMTAAAALLGAELFLVGIEDGDFAERAGILNLGLEGMMLIGAMSNETLCIGFGILKKRFSLEGLDNCLCV